MNYNGGANLKEEIRERIEMINKGQVPEGYKKTKVGIIPKDREVKNGFIEIMSVYGFKLNEYVDRGIPLIRINNVKYGEISNEDLVYLPESYKEEYNRFLLQKGDILLALNRPITNNRLK